LPISPDKNTHLTHIYTHKHTLSCTHTHKQSAVPRTHMHTHAHTLMHTHAQTQIHTHTHTHTHIFTHRHTYIHTCTHIHNGALMVHSSCTRKLEFPSSKLEVSTVKVGHQKPRWLPL